MQPEKTTLPAVRVVARILGMEGRYGHLMKWGLLAVSAWLLTAWGGLGFLRGRGWDLEAYALAGYAASNLVCSLLFNLALRWSWRHGPPFSERFWRGALALSCLLDHLFVAALIAHTGGPQSEFYLLFGLLALKAAVYYPYAPELVFVTFLSGPLWVVAADAYADSLYFLNERRFRLQYGALFLWVIGCAVVGWLMERRQRSISTLDANLSRTSETLADQARIVQQTAANLADRLLELRSLQESVKAINSALTLDELLQLVVENASMVLRGARCTIALVDDRRGLVSTLAAAGIPKGELWGTAFRVGEAVAGWVVQNRKPALIPVARADARFQHVGNWPIGSLVCVPLIADNQVIGALTATSPERNAFTETDVNLLDAFGDQAAMAVKNARLYEQLVQEEKETARLYRSVLEKSNELEAILGGIGDGVIVIDPQAGLLMMNPVAARLVRLSQAPQPGMRLPEVVSNEALLALARDSLADPDTPLIREITLPGDGDRQEIYQALASAVKGAEGNIRGIVIVMRDVTSQKEIERIKSNFLSVVSHELRTPLHSIKGFVDIILMGKTGEINDLQRDFLTTVQEATTNLQRLIEDLLEFSRLEAGQIKLKPEMISVYDVAEKVVGQLTPLAQENQLKLANTIPEHIPLVEADPLRIEQVFTNLISNAIKFTPAEGTITVTAEDRDDQVQAAVRDTGIGIPVEEQAKIFQRFYQVDSSVTRAYRGAGLGLTICKFIVEYHHGHIGVESQPGQGSTFYFTLPKQLPQDQARVIDFTIPAARRE